MVADMKEMASDAIFEGNMFFYSYWSLKFFPYSDVGIVKSDFTLFQLL
jgi:hypothetical protein